MIDPALVARAHALKDRLLPLSEVSASQAGPIGGGHPDSGMPAGVAFTESGDVVRLHSLLEVFGARLDLAEARDSEEEYRSALAWGKRQLDSITHGPVVVAESPREFRERIVRDYEGVIAPTVAARERCSVTLVREARDKLGRTARFGHKIAGGGLAGQGEG